MVLPRTARLLSTPSATFHELACGIIKRDRLDAVRHHHLVMQDN